MSPGQPDYRQCQKEGDTPGIGLAKRGFVQDLCGVLIYPTEPSENQAPSVEFLLFMRAGLEEMVRGHCGRNPALPLAWMESLQSRLEVTTDWKGLITGAPSRRPSSPRYVEYISAVPVGFNLAMKASTSHHWPKCTVALMETWGERKDQRTDSKTKGPNHNAGWGRECYALESDCFGSCLTTYHEMICRLGGLMVRVDVFVLEFHVTVAAVGQKDLRIKFSVVKSGYLLVGLEVKIRVLVLYTWARAVTNGTQREVIRKRLTPLSQQLLEFALNLRGLVLLQIVLHLMPLSYLCCSCLN